MSEKYNPRLNNFILWCKGWYIPTDKYIDIFEQAAMALKLDGYVLATRKYVVDIALNYIDELVDKNVFNGRPNYLRCHVWNQNVCIMMHLHNVDYNKAVLMVVRNFFAFHIDNTVMTLNPPVYSRELYKLGFVAPKEYGNSYKMANSKVKEIFKKPENKIILK